LPLDVAKTGVHYIQLEEEEEKGKKKEKITYLYLAKLNYIDNVLSHKW